MKKGWDNAIPILIHRSATSMVTNERVDNAIPMLINLNGVVVRLLDMPTQEVKFSMLLSANLELRKTVLYGSIPIRSVTTITSIVHMENHHTS